MMLIHREKKLLVSTPKCTVFCSFYTVMMGEVALPAVKEKCVAFPMFLLQRCLLDSLSSLFQVSLLCRFHSLLGNKVK